MMSIALRQSQMDIFDFISLFSVAETSELSHEVQGFGCRWDDRG